MATVHTMKANVYLNCIRESKTDQAGFYRGHDQTVVLDQNLNPVKVTHLRGPRVVVRIETSRMLIVDANDMWPAVGTYPPAMRLPTGTVAVEKNRNNTSDRRWLLLKPNFDKDGRLISIVDEKGSDLRFEVLEQIEPPPPKQLGSG